MGKATGCGHHERWTFAPSVDTAPPACLACELDETKAALRHAGEALECEARCHCQPGAETKCRRCTALANPAMVAVMSPKEGKP